MQVRGILAANLRAHLDRRFRAEDYLTDQATAFAKVAGIGASTVMRIVTRRRAASLDTLERIAKALRVPVHTLLLPAKSRPEETRRRRQA